MSWPGYLDVLRNALRESFALRLALWIQIVMLLFSVVALPLDHRVILGLNPWIKPMKFEISVILYLLTITLMLYGLGQDGAWRRTRLWLGWGFMLCMTFENGIIAEQSLRGVRSHMNYATVLDALLFAVMGLLIALNTALVAILLAFWCFAKTRTEVTVTWGVRLGLLMLLLGSMEGVYMVQHGAHTVGAKDGSLGLPFVNWSRGFGDLRVAHFFALHSLQLLPLIGLALTRTRWRPQAQVAALWLFTVVYVGGVWWLFHEARNGRPFLRY